MRHVPKMPVWFTGLALLCASLVPHLSYAETLSGTSAGVDPFTGAYTYTYPIPVPPGRDGMAPELTLSYSSANNTIDSPFGYGWNVTIPTISRVNRLGTEVLYTEHDFTATFSGMLDDVVLSDGMHGTYWASVDDGKNLTYTYNTDETWTVTDKLGVVYTFGGTANGVIDDPNTPSHIAVWYLTEARDTNDNVITYSYTKDSSQVYPSVINYTGHGASSGLFDIVFDLEGRVDVSTSYAYGFPVTTNNRVDAIRVEEADNTVRTLNLSYAEGDNTLRSMLTSITESGKDSNNVTISKPATTFTYATSTKSWTEETSFSMPIPIVSTTGGNLGVFVFDINGDALPDLVKSTNTVKEVYINNGNHTWTLDANYVIPESFVSNTGKDTGVRVADFNGDGLLDLLSSHYTTGSNFVEAIYLNDGDGTGWTQYLGADIPIGFVSSNGTDSAVRVFDVNGDGFPDIVQAVYSGSSVISHVYLHNGDGSGWTEDTNAVVPVAFRFANGGDVGVRTVDVNADGLTDLVYGRILNDNSLESAVYVNQGNGNGWALNTEYAMPIAIVNKAGQDMGVRFFDHNADGLTDMVYSRLNGSGQTVSGVYINDGDGTGWTLDAALSIPIPFVNATGADLGVRTNDYEGETLEDILSSKQTSSTTWDDRFFDHNGGAGDLAVSTDTSAGATITVSYSSSVPTSPELFFPLLVADTITVDDGLGNVGVTDYAFVGGDYYFAAELDRTFAGFSTLTTEDPAGNITTTYYHQGDETNASLGESTDGKEKIGHAFREEIRNAANALYEVTITGWEKQNIDTGFDRVVESNVLTLGYDGDADHRDIAVEKTYDITTGNLVQTVELGEVSGSTNGAYTDTGTDDRTRTISYATWSGDGTSGYVSTSTVTDHNDAIMSEETTRYDDNLDTTVVKGNATKVIERISATAAAETSYAYDAFGFVTDVIDPNGNTTTYQPDAYELYPVTVAKPLAQAEAYVYDYTSGKVTETVDVNGYTSQTLYDGFDRPVLEKKPDPTAPASLIPVKTVSYNDAVFPAIIHETEHFTAAVAKEKYSYLDGLARPVQERTEAEGVNAVVVIDTVYNERGDVEKTSLPYEDTGTTHEAATTTAALLETYTWDPLSRLTAKTNVSGSTVTTYDDGTVTQTDEANAVKVYEKDVFDNLSEVTEFNGAQTGVTVYVYDAKGNMLQMTDADGNVRNFTYDNLNRRLTAEDLHAPADTEFGGWTYAYDPAGNLTQSYDPAGITTAYTYDALNRLEVVNSDATPATEETYVYDLCTNGVGKVCEASILDGASTTYEYDAVGRVASEHVLVDGNLITTSFTHERQDNVLEVLYPDGSVAANVLDDAGQIDSVLFDDIGAGGPTALVSNITYAPTGNVKGVDYANGITTAITFDPAELYRLDTVVTTDGTLDIQNFTYTHDSIGNITAITDTSDLYLDVSTTYDYDELYRMTDAVAVSQDPLISYNKNWVYNKINNITSSTDHGARNYNGANPGNFANPHAPTTVNGDSLTYDALGNLTSDGTWTHTWNFRGEPIVSSDGLREVRYVYNHTGQRVLQDGSGSTILTPNDYVTIEGTQTRRNIIVDGLGSFATSIYDANTELSSEVYHHTDHLGSIHVETNSLGLPLEIIHYDPFGKIILDEKTSTYDSIVKYNGKPKDADTTLHYYGERYYNGPNDTFISEDPVFIATGTAERLPEQAKAKADPQLMNSYAYARNNSVNLKDPNGAFPEYAHMTIFSRTTPLAHFTRDPYSPVLKPKTGRLEVIMSNGPTLLRGNNRPLEQRSSTPWGMTHVREVFQSITPPEEATAEAAGVPFIQ